MGRILVFLPVLLVVALACGGDDDSGDATPTVSPSGAFNEGACLFNDSFLDEDEVTCGYLTVPADREDPATGDIRLAVAIFKAEDDDPRPDPVVYLEGGPGGNALEAIDLSFDYLVEPFLDERDFIVFDQRGTGYSKPSMPCRDLDQLFMEVDEDLTDEEYIQASLDAARKCRDRLESTGVSTGLANSAENAADLEDLRIALGYEEWNLYGISYGTRLALTEMRDAPDGLRSVILDSTYPPEVDLVAGTIGSLDRAFNALFDDCAADEDCNDAFPGLKDVLLRTVQELNANPQMTEAGLIGETGILVTGDLLVNTLFQALYATEIIGDLPQVIYDVSDGDYAYLADLVYFFELSGQYFTTGMYLSTQCTEEVPFTSPEKVQEAAEQFPDFAGSQMADAESYFELCDAWGAEPAGELENQPVESDVPTLVMAGRYDPITPPEWGKAVADRLETAYFFEFPMAGHGVIPSVSCAERVARLFLDDPTEEPSPSCLERMDPPAFEAFDF